MTVAQYDMVSGLVRMVQIERYKCSLYPAECPTQNGYIKWFNGSYRRVVLGTYIFRSIEGEKQVTQERKYYYNN